MHTIDQLQKDILSLFLESFYTAAHWLGGRIVDLIGMIIPQADALNQIVDPIGVLAILSILLLLAQFARKIVWIVVGVGWALILIRIIMIAMK